MSADTATAMDQVCALLGQTDMALSVRVARLESELQHVQDALQHMPATIAQVVRQAIAETRPEVQSNSGRHDMQSAIEEALRHLGWGAASTPAPVSGPVSASAPAATLAPATGMVHVVPPRVSPERTENGMEHHKATMHKGPTAARPQKQVQSIDGDGSSQETSTRVELPRDFAVNTKDTVAVAWQKWICGDVASHLPPMRAIHARDIRDKAQVRRLSDLRCVMQEIERLTRAASVWIENASIPQAALMLQAVQDKLPLDASTASGRARKKELAWTTALNLLRRGKKRKQDAMCL